MSRNVHGTAGFEEGKGSVDPEGTLDRQKPSKKEREQEEEIAEAAPDDQVFDIVAE